MEKSPSHWWDFPSAALFLLAILTTAWRLWVTDWTDHLGYAVNLSLLGAILGLAFGASRFSKNVVRWLGLGYMLVLIPRQLIALYEDEMYLGERLANVGGRLLFSISEFAADKPVKDPLFFIALIGTLYFLIAMISGYYLARHNNTLAAILPAGLAILIIQHMDRGEPEKIWLIAVFIFAALGLIGRGKYLRDRVGWVKLGVQLAPETGPDITMGALAGAAVLILLAWSLPLSIIDQSALEEKWQEITKPWRSTRDRLSRAFEALEGEGGRVEYFRGSMPLGNKASQEDTLALSVYASAEALELPRLYWRARIYDHYENGIWSTSRQEVDDFSPQDEEISIPDTEFRKEYEFTFSSYIQQQAVIYSPSQPVWISRSVDVRSFSLPNDQRDVVVLEAYPFIRSGEFYRVRASIANPSVKELRAAGEDYPEWVKEHYLQLPGDFSERIRGFASSVTFGLETPYDKTAAITTVLRAQTTYNPSITPPSDGSDLMEWFLFEGREGYCNYYATAEVLMLRTLGIPARLAVGFAQGEPTSQEFEYAVQLRNAHAWPEVYFPGYGWIEFEPTGNQIPLERPLESESDLDPDSDLELGVNPDDNVPAFPPPIEELGDIPRPNVTPVTPLWAKLLIASAIILAVGAALFLLEKRFTLSKQAAVYVLSATKRRGDQSPAWVQNAALFVLADPFERAFHPINLSLRWLGESPALHLTPAERAGALKQIMPEAENEIETLLHEFHDSQYTPRRGNLQIARRAGWKVLWKGVRAYIRKVQADWRW